MSGTPVLRTPGREHMRTSGVVSEAGVAASEADLLQGEAKAQQVGTHRQAKLQQETAKEVVLGLEKEGDTMRAWDQML